MGNTTKIKSWHNVNVKHEKILKIKQVIDGKPELNYKTVPHFIDLAIEKELDRLENLPMFEEVIVDIDNLKGSLDEIKEEIKGIGEKFSKELDQIRDTIAKAEAL